MKTSYMTNQSNSHRYVLARLVAEVTGGLLEDDLLLLLMDFTSAARLNKQHPIIDFALSSSRWIMEGEKSEKKIQTGKH